MKGLGSFRRDLYCILLIISAIFLCWGYSLTSYFLADDFMLIEKAQNTDWKDLKNIASSFTLSAKDSSLWWVPKDVSLQFFRPLALFSFYTDYNHWRLNPFGFYLTNLAIHIISSIFVFLIISSLYDRKVGLLSSLIFAAHPALSESVAWISGRCDSLCGLFYFASFYSFVAYCKEKRKSMLIRSLLAFCFALSSKETAITLPLMLILYNRERLRAWLLFLCIVFIYSIFRLIFFNIGNIPQAILILPTQPDFALSILRNIFSYLSCLLFGISPMLWNPLWGIPSMIFMGISVVTIIIIFILFKVLKREILFPSLWILIALLPALFIIPFSRYLYIPILGFSVIVSLFIIKAISWHKRLGTVFLFVVFAGYATFDIANCALMKLGSSTLFKVIESTKEYYPTLPKNSRLYFINLSPLACLSTSQAFRLFYNDPTLSCYVLTMSPNFGPRCDSYIDVIDEHTIVVGLNRENFFSNPFAKFFLLGETLKEGDRIDCDGFSATIRKDAKEILFQFKDSIKSEKSYFFEFFDWKVSALFRDAK